MVEYTCNKCFKIFTHKHNFLYHTKKRKSDCLLIKDKINNISNDVKKVLEKKYEEVSQNLPFDIINSFQIDNYPELNNENLKLLPIYNQKFNEPICVFCNKLFVTNSHRNRHMNNNCIVRKRYIDLIKILDIELENLYTENRFLRNKYMSLFGDQFLFPFGTEKYIGYEQNLIIDSIKNPYKGIPEFIEAYHFNPSEQRYNNIQIKNPRSSHLEIYNGTDWVIETKENVIQTLLRTYKDIVDMEIDNYIDSLPPMIIKSYNDFSEFIDLWLSFILYDTELTPYQKKYAKPIYNKIYTAIELMIINCFRKDVFTKIEEEIFNFKK